MVRRDALSIAYLSGGALCIIALQPTLRFRALVHAFALCLAVVLALAIVSIAFTRSARHFPLYAGAARGPPGATGNGALFDGWEGISLLVILPLTLAFLLQGTARNWGVTHRLWHVICLSLAIVSGVQALLTLASRLSDGSAYGVQGVVVAASAWVRVALQLPIALMIGGKRSRAAARALCLVRVSNDADFQLASLAPLLGYGLPERFVVPVDKLVTDAAVVFRPVQLTAAVLTELASNWQDGFDGNNRMAARGTARSRNSLSVVVVPFAPSGPSAAAAALVNTLRNGLATDSEDGSPTAAPARGTAMALGAGNQARAEPSCARLRASARVAECAIAVAPTTLGDPGGANGGDGGSSADETGCKAAACGSVCACGGAQRTCLPSPPLAQDHDALPSHPPTHYEHNSSSSTVEAELKPIAMTAPAASRTYSYRAKLKPSRTGRPLSRTGGSSSVSGSLRGYGTACRGPWDQSDGYSSRSGRRLSCGGMSSSTSYSAYSPVSRSMGRTSRSNSNGDSAQQSTHARSAGAGPLTRLMPAQLRVRPPQLAVRPWMASPLQTDLLPCADFFVLHGAFDSPTAKLDALRHWAGFVDEACMPLPTTWLDDLCSDVTLLPTEKLSHAVASMACCQKVLLVAGPKLLDDLFAVALIHAWNALGRSIEDVEVVLAVADKDEQATHVLAAFDTFAVMYSHAASASDEVQIVHSIEIASVSTYNEAVRAMLPRVRAAIDAQTKVRNAADMAADA